MARDPQGRVIPAEPEGVLDLCRGVVGSMKDYKDEYVADEFAGRVIFRPDKGSGKRGHEAIAVPPHYMNGSGSL